MGGNFIETNLCWGAIPFGCFKIEVEKQLSQRCSSAIQLMKKVRPLVLTGELGFYIFFVYFGNCTTTAMIFQ